MPTDERHIVVVGGGVTGLVAARAACKYGGDNTKVTILESEPRLGGHAYTADGPTGEKIDVGFMVMNDLTYPNLINVFKEIGAETEPSDMSFSVVDKDFTWSFQDTVSWKLHNLWRPRLWKFMSSHGKFAKRGIEFLRKPEPRNMTIREFAGDLDETFVNHWLVPFISAVWSASPAAALDFPALPLLKFMHHHMFLTLDTVKWQTPKGRSETYVKKLIESCPKLNVRTSCPVKSIEAEERVLILANGERIKYDSLILTCSAPIQASMNPPSKEWLSKFKSNPSSIVCHTGEYGLPKDKADWASWNVAGGAKSGPSVTYWLSRLQNLSNKSIFLTLNPETEPEGTFFKTSLDHPVMDVAAFEGQEEEAAHQGKHGVYHAGAWLRNGFHEDGTVSGLIAARRALGREDIPVEFPTLPGLTAEAVAGWSSHTRKLPEANAYAIKYPLNLYRFDTCSPPPTPSFTRTDHFGDPSVPLDTCVRRELHARLGYWPLGHIEAVCNLRYAGCCFNPITPFFAHDEHGVVKALLLEVHNTPWNERTLYAMRVGPGDVLEPAVHPKQMHVSPFNKPPQAEADTETAADDATEYKFTIRGKEEIEIEVRSVLKKEVKMTATWNVTGGATHDVKTGSWRTMGMIYWQAIILFKSGLTMFTYNTPALPWTSPLMLAQVGFAAVAVGHASAGSYLSALAFTALMISLLAHHRSQGVNLVYMAATIIATLACTLLNVSYSPGARMTEIGGCAAAAVLCYVLSNTADTKFESLRLVCYLNASLGSLSIVVPLSLWMHAACAWATMLFFVDALADTGSIGYAALLVQVASLVALAGSCASEGMVDCGTAEAGTAIFATHLLHELATSSSSYTFYATLAFAAIGAMALPSTLTFSWPALYVITAAYVLYKVLWKYLSTHAPLLEARDRNLVHVMQIVIRSLTKGTVELVSDSCPQTTRVIEKGKVAIIKVNKPLAFFEAITNGELGFGEAYVRQEWECGEDTTVLQVLYAFVHSGLNENAVLESLRYFSPMFLARKAAFILKFGSLDRKQSADSIAEHYDDGNVLFESFLGDGMVYTSASWDGIDPKAGLFEAQKNKVDRILELTQASGSKDKKLLDIGSGWGYLVSRAREEGMEAYGLCNCRSMVGQARALFGEEAFKLMDYRDIPATHEYDAITAVEMIEAVPASHYPEFVSACDRALKPGGRVVMQVINALSFNNVVARKRNPDPLGTFVTTHIFPGQQIPNMEFLHEAFLKSGKFKRVYSECEGHAYARTLALWNANLEANASKFPPSVVRKYRYYFNFCEVGFGSELLHLSRVVFQKID